MRVGFLTHYFPPEAGAPQTRIALLAGALADRGHEVVVHTCPPHYPAGRILPPYRNPALQRERRNGFTVVRSWVYAAPNRGLVRRLVNHASFGASALLTARASGLLDVLVAETPPLFTGGAGALYALAKRTALVVNVADRWPASAVELGALSDRRAIAMAEALERFVYRRAQLITSPTEGLTRELSTLPDAQGKCRRTWPVVDIARFDPSPPPAASPHGPLQLLYAGTIGMAQGLSTLLRASRLAGDATVQTTVVGDGAEAAELAALVERERIANVHLLGVRPSTDIPSLLHDADAVAVLLRDIPLFRGALPTKLLEAMAAGRPVLLSGRGEAAELVLRCGAGLVVEPEDPRALADAIRQLQGDSQLRAQMGAAGRRFAEARLGADRSAVEWSARLEEAVSRLRR